MAWIVSMRSVFFIVFTMFWNFYFLLYQKYADLQFMRIALFGLVLKVWFKSFRPLLVYMLLFLGIGLSQQIFQSFLDGLTTFVWIYHFILVFIGTQKSGDRWLENLINVNTIYCNWLGFLTSNWGLSIHFSIQIYINLNLGLKWWSCPKVT